MRKLLAANFARLFKNKLFWLEIVLMAAWGVYLSIWNNVNALEIATLDHVFFNFITGIGIFLAVFCSLFLGTEYSDGTIRNKLVVGHTRSAIYFSNVIVCTAAGLLMCCAFIAAVSAAGIPLLGFFTASIKTVLLYLLACAALIITFSSFMTLLSMLNQNKAVVAVVSIIVVLALLFIATEIYRLLSASEFYDIMISKDSVMTLETVRNENYLEGTARALYEFFFDFLPTGQAMQLSGMSALHLWRLPVYSLVLIILTNTAGVLAFRKKNLK